MKKTLEENVGLLVVVFVVVVVFAICVLYTTLLKFCTGAPLSLSTEVATRISSKKQHQSLELVVAQSSLTHPI